MARHQHRDRIRPARAAHGADRLGPANHRRDFTVAFGFTQRDFPQRVPDALLKFCSHQIQRWKYLWLVAGESFFQRGGGGAMPRADFGGDALRRIQADPQVRPAIWIGRKINFSQTFFRIAGEKNSVARADGEFDDLNFCSGGL